MLKPDARNRRTLTYGDTRTSRIIVDLGIAGLGLWAPSSG